jgi:hypothetical protein
MAKPPTPEQALAEEAKIKSKLAEITLKAWTDQEFARLLETDSSKALAKVGLTVPPGLTVHFHCDREHDVHFVIPTSPAYYIKDHVQFHLERLSKLHAEVTSTTSWVQKPDT